MKYEPLKRYLKDQSLSEVPMEFEEIERLIGEPLPASAFKYPAWWSNNPSNNVMTRAWLDAGFRTERVQLGSHRLVFRRSAGGQGPKPHKPEPAPAAALKSADPLEGLYGGLQGTVRPAPDLDLTAPVGDDWAAE